MINWQFQAIDGNGTKVKGRIRAANKADALKLVIDRGLSPLSCQELKPEAGLFSRIKAGDLEQITTELALLLRNGVQLDRALDMMSESNPNVDAAAILNSMTDDVRGGSQLYKAFARFPRYFDRLFCEMVKVGEESGQLASTLERLSQNQKFQNDLQSKVNQALIYPAFILSVCVMALFAIFNFIVPSMAGLLSNMEEIPAYTQFLLSTSAWMQQNQTGLFVAIVLVVLLIMQSWRKPWFKELISAVLRNLPVMSSGMLLADRIRYVSAMQLMLQSGLSLSQALSFSVSVVNDIKLQRQLARVRDEVIQGRMLSESIASTDILEPIMLTLVKVGEESGRLDQVFTEMADRSRRKFEQWAMKLTSMLEPLLIILMGGLVGSVVVTMLLSIMSTTDVPL